MPGRAAQRENARCRNGAQMGPNVIVYARRDLCRPAATTLGLARRQARGCAKASPALGAATICDLEANEQPELQVVWMVVRRAGRKRQALSTPSTGEQFMKNMLAGTYPYESKQSNPASLRPTRLQHQVQP